MNEDVAAQFQEHFKPDGGLLPLALTGDLKAYFLNPKRKYDEITGGLNRHLAGSKTPARLHFDFVRNLELNACADRYQRHPTYFIAFNQGAILGIKLLFDLILADPSVLTHIGNPREERALVPSYSSLDWMSGNLISQIDRLLMSGASKRPFCPLGLARCEYATTLLTHALDFVFFHELAHVQNGHVDFFAKKTGQTRMREVSQIQSRIPLTQQAMELQADAFAGNILFRKSLDVPYETPRDDLRAMGFAHTLLFVVFDRVGASIRNYRESSHPHPAVRHPAVIAGMQTDAKSRRLNAATYEDLFSSYEEGVIDAHQTALSLGISSSLQKAVFGRADDAIAENQRIWNHLKTVIPELQKFAFVP